MVALVDVCGGENEVDDDVGGDVDWGPGYRVLTWQLRGDFAEILGARYDLQVEDPVSARCGGGTLLVSTLLPGLGWGALVEAIKSQRLTLGSHSCLFHIPPFFTGPASCPTRQTTAGTPHFSAPASSSNSPMYFDSP